jgi:hypothetical protein
MIFSENPKIWGPHAWFFLHSIALHYPDNPTPVQKLHYKSFFILLADVLPCDQCQINMSNYLQNHRSEFDRAFQNKTSLYNWTIRFHNHVNNHKLKS